MRGFSQAEVEILIDDVAWQPIASLAQAGPDDPVYELDPHTGQVRFGDGMYGRRPPAGSNIQATYRYGGGQAGEVASSTWSWFVPGPEQVVSLGITALGEAIQIHHRQSKLTWRWRLASWLCDWLWRG